jgi:hypothetical protein
MKLLPVVTALLMAGVLGACATAPTVDYNHQANFARYHTFSWIPVKHPRPVKNPVLDSQILDQRVRKAVVNTLTQHGYRRVADAKQADFLVTYQTATEQQLRAYGGFRSGFAFGYPFYGPFIGSPFYGPLYDPFFGVAFYPGLPYQIRSYQQGHLIVDVIDGDTHQLVWRGWTSATVRPDNYSQSAVTDMVKTILSRFPPSTP